MLCSIFKRVGSLLGYRRVAVFAAQLHHSAAWTTNDYGTLVPAHYDAVYVIYFHPVPYDSDGLTANAEFIQLLFAYHCYSLPLLASAISVLKSLNACSRITLRL